MTGPGDCAEPTGTDPNSDNGDWHGPGAKDPQTDWNGPDLTDPEDGGDTSWPEVGPPFETDP
jgi:hypothetical protein